MTLAQRIKILRKELGLNQTEFAQKVGITQTSLSQIEGEKNGISYDVFKSIVSQFDVNPMWLMDGIGGMLMSNLGTARSDNHGAVPLVVQVSNDEEENIIMVDKKAAAGYLQHQQDPEYIAKLPSFRLPGYYGKTFRAFEITGDSMLPGILPGDVIVGSYVESLKEIHVGEVYIVVTDDGSIVAKRISARINDLFELKSDNPVYAPYTVKAESLAQIWKAESRITKEFALPDEKESEPGMSDIEKRIAELERRMSS